MNDKELLEDTTFDREIAPRDRESDFLVKLLKFKAFDKESGIKVYKWDILKEEKALKKRKLIKIKKYAKKDYKIWLTPKGKIVAFGEYFLRKREGDEEE